MTCLLCNEPMISGYVQATGEVYFTEKPHRFHFGATGNDVVLTRHNWTGPTCTAWHCPKCRRVIIEYGRY